MVTGRTVLIAVEMLSVSIWVGSLVCLALVSTVARRVLDAPSRVALFRGVGRVYGIVGTGALLVAIAAGVAIAGRPSTWSVGVVASIVLAILLVALTGVAMVQARAMTVQRQRALGDAHDESAARVIRRGATTAGALRGVMGLLTLVILLLGAHLIDR
jgi:hypothetical protein